MTVTPQGVTGDVSRDDGGGTLSSRASAAFFDRETMLPVRWGGLRTPVQVFYNGADGVGLEFGSPDFKVTVDTTLAGLDALIGKLQAAKARIET